MPTMTIKSVSGVFEYCLKFFVFYATLCLYAVFSIPYLLLQPKGDRKLPVSLLSARIFSWLFSLRVEVRGLEYLCKTQTCIIAANHQSAIDLVGMSYLWPHLVRCRTMIKKAIWYAWPFGLAMWLADVIFVTRNSDETEKRRLNDIMQSVKQKKRKMWIFVEGARYNTGHLHAFKKGAFYIAINNQVPILPIVFSSYYFLSDEEMRFDSGRIIITITPPISTKGLDIKDIPNLMEETNLQMSQVLQSVNEELRLSLKN